MQYGPKERDQALAVFEDITTAYFATVDRYGEPAKDLTSREKMFAIFGEEVIEAAVASLKVLQHGNDAPTTFKALEETYDEFCDSIVVSLRALVCIRKIIGQGGLEDEQ